MRSETTAILVDGGYYQHRARALWGAKSAQDRADELMHYCHLHLGNRYGKEIVHDDLYRIFYYDCPPYDGSVFHPLQQRNINQRKTPMYTFMMEFHKIMRAQRKVAVRMGKLASNDRMYSLTIDAQKRLFRGEITLQELQESDFRLSINQKGVDMRIGLDIASMAFKKQVTRIILIAGDSDFVPAAKLARREGIDFILDPMEADISEDLSEHIDGIRSRVKAMRTYNPAPDAARSITPEQIGEET